MVQFIYHIKIELHEASLWFKFNMFLSFMTYFMNLSTYYIKFEHWIESYTLYISILWKEYDSSKWLIFKFNTECGFGYMSGVWRFEFCVFPFSFFGTCLRRQTATVHEQLPYYLTFQPFFNTLVGLVPWTVHRTYKSHFLATFSLKMSLTVLFTHLKITLL